MKNFHAVITLKNLSLSALICSVFFLSIVTFSNLGKTSVTLLAYSSGMLMFASLAAKYLSLTEERIKNRLDSFRKQDRDGFKGLPMHPDAWYRPRDKMPEEKRVIVAVSKAYHDHPFICFYYNGAWYDPQMAHDDDWGLAEIYEDIDVWSYCATKYRVID